MDNKEFAIRIGRFLAGCTGFGVPVRAVDGGLACDGSGSASDSPGVVALIGYHITPFSRPQDQKVCPKAKKMQKTQFDL